VTANLLTLWYLAASVCFILALKGLSSPESARRGNYLGIAGMVIAVLFTLAIVKGHGMIVLGVLIGAAIGTLVARRVQMTQMPQLVAAMHSLVGMAAVLIAIAAVNNPASFNVPDPLPRGNKLELFIGTFVGAITFSGSAQATATCPTPAATARRHTWTIIGCPWMFAKGLPGRRDEPMRAGMRTIGVTGAVEPMRWAVGGAKGSEFGRCARVMPDSTS